MVEKGSIEVVYVPTNDMAADTLTKALPREEYEKYMAMFELQHMDIAVGGNVCTLCDGSFRSMNDFYKDLRHGCKGTSKGNQPGEAPDAR